MMPAAYNNQAYSMRFKQACLSIPGALRDEQAPALYSESSA
jgi:hypothetical protein